MAESAPDDAVRLRVRDRESLKAFRAGNSGFRNPLAASRESGKIRAEPRRDLRSAVISCWARGVRQFSGLA